MSPQKFSRDASLPKIVSKSKSGCQMKKRTLHDRYSDHLLCIQLNYGRNTSELKKAFHEGDAYRYLITLYKHSETSFKLAFTVNSARVVP